MICESSDTVSIHMLLYLLPSANKSNLQPDTNPVVPEERVCEVYMWHQGEFRTNIH